MCKIIVRLLANICLCLMQRPASAWWVYTYPAVKVLCMCVCVYNISNQCTSHSQSISRPGVVRGLETSSLLKPGSASVFAFLLMDVKTGDSSFRHQQASQDPKGPGNRKTMSLWVVWYSWSVLFCSLVHPCDTYVCACLCINSFMTFEHCT